ncbi:MAG TPA: DUF1501 domain-containing protein [Gemmataceae bacterium]|nr:DUF1501 domain-containing protein [Gemmataceae bacterium]
MLRILGSPKRVCGGWTRREMLQAGALGLFGLGMSDFFRLTDLQAKPSHLMPRSFGRARSCILLHLYGSPSQIETFDMKPDAPVEIRGELKPVRSSLAGLDVCELLPNLAKVMDRCTVVRSMTHPYPIHGVAYTLTGVPQIDIPMELNPHDPRHWPFVGSVIAYLAQKNGRASLKPVPDNIALPFRFSSQRVGEVARAGPYAGFLGNAYNPIWTEFHGTATHRVVKTLQDQHLDVRDPYCGITPESGFELANGTRLPDEITLDRLNGRLRLAEQFDQARRDLDQASAGQSLDHYREMALSLIGSEKIRTALDLTREPPELRASYGMTLFGQSCLAARRLVEAGTRFITVFWDEYGLAGSGWDTHWDHYPRMKNELLPGLDRAWAGLIADLDARGLLEETLVLCVSEHGRTPKMQNVKGGGRDHWSQAYSSLFAGGGIARGRILGKTDKIAGSVLDHPVSPKDILATLYHLMGIDPHTTIRDRTGRPLPLVSDGQVVTNMLA